MPTMSSHQSPSTGGSYNALPSTAQALTRRTASSRAAMYKLLIWATVGFVALAVLNTAVGR